MLLRVLRVPARIVNGFQAGEYNEIGENFVIRGRDAHSWVEVWIQGKGWLAFDPTPASAEPFSRSQFSVVLGNYLDAFELFWAEWVVGYDDVIQISLFRDLQDKTAQLSAMSQRSLYRSWRGLQQTFHAVLAGTVQGVRESPISVLMYALATLILGILLLAAWKVQRRLWTRRSMQTNPARLAVRFYGDFLDLAANYGKSQACGCNARRICRNIQEIGSPATGRRTNRHLSAGAFLPASAGSGERNSAGRRSLA